MREVGINQVHSLINRGLQLAITTKTATKETEIVSAKAIWSHPHSEGFWLPQPTEIR